MADNTPSLLDQVLSAITSIANGSVEDLAKVLGIWASAKAAISTVAGGVASAASQAVVNAANANYHSVPLSPAVLATAIVRNVLPDSTKAAGTPPPGYPNPLFNSVGAGSPDQEAALSGLQADRFAALVGSTGMSYGVIDALRMLNRAVGTWKLAKNTSASPTAPRFVADGDLGGDWGITADQFAGVVAHSDIRPEYIPELLKLARNSVTPADAVEMVVKQIIDPATGRDLFAAAGGFPEQFDALVAGAGDALGPEKMVDMLAHGLITEQFGRQALGMSRVNPDFYSAYITAAGGPGPVHRKYLSPYEIESLVKAHPDLADQAMAWLDADGYDPDQAQAWVNALVGGTVAKVKEDTTAEVLKMYGAKLYDQAEATTALQNLGYTAAAIPVLLEQAEAQSIIAAHNSAVSRVRASYLVQQITDTQATVALQALGVPVAAINDFISDWHVERTTPTHHLSEATVGKLLKEGYISPETAQAKWVAMGYSANDAALLLLIYPWPGQEPAGTGTPAATAG